MTVEIDNWQHYFVCVDDFLLSVFQKMSSGIEEDDTIQREKKKNREEEEKKNKQEADETKAQPKETPKRNSGMVFYTLLEEHSILSDPEIVL